MDVYWDGVTKNEDFSDEEADRRKILADAAKSCDWAMVIKLVEGNKNYANACRLGGNSYFSPLHHAAYNGAPAQIVMRLIEFGAWRTLQNAYGERPIDVAARQGQNQLQVPLEPVKKHSVPNGVLLKIEYNFHAIIRARLEQDLPDRNLELRLPQLEPLLELDRPEMWFPVPGMYGGFRYRLENIGADAKLVSSSWCRVVEGSVQRHEVTCRGSRLIAKGSV